MAGSNGKPKATASERHDQQLAQVALQKRQRGERATREEAAALKRIERQREENLRWDYYRSIPQKHWITMSCRQRRTIVDQAEKYGLPIAGRTIDLSAVAKALHDFLSKNATKLLSDDPLMAGGDSPALERYRTARARMVEIELEEKIGTLVDRAKCRAAIEPVPRCIRAGIKTLHQRFGPEARDIMDEALDEAERVAIDVARNDPEPESHGRQTK